ncbi:MAG: NADH:ubiquinone oxidoreductase [Lentisphaerae bacterium GWF2_52_8]|nr:MAG: NADH:ubiquinone oxidoreductase [Lentisphaerae bacterium GWF2_52_8]
MGSTLAADVRQICKDFGNDPVRLIDVARALQSRYGSISKETIALLSAELKIPRVRVESTVSFYSFLSEAPKGKIVIRLCDDIIDRFSGVELVADVFRRELGIDFGETTPDGLITLEWTPCIGMCDQAPAALVNEVVVTELSSDKVRDIIQVLRETRDPRKLTRRYGDGNNASPLVRSMVCNNIRKRGFIFTEKEKGEALRKALAMSPVEVIREVKAARLRGRGGAGFPAGMKWDFTRASEGDEKYVICNADEGEPGTFKDRAILTEKPELLFEGMTIAGYAIGAQNGIVYLRGEYAYLRRFLEDVLEKRRQAGCLGKDVCGKKGFNFDIRIQSGAGSYVCGEETSLISSCEGLRGDPKNRPPFPAQKGYLGKPTSVNNVETFCYAVRVIENGAAWFAGIGSKGSAGTKLLSIAGDCAAPGVYEYAFGTPLRQILKDVGAEDVLAVQIGGPSGKLVGEADFDRVICYDDLATGGALVIFNKERNILEIVRYYLEFFVEESCGYCTPCRVGNVLMERCLDKILNGQGEPSDLPYLEALGETIKVTSRCGLGQTSPNPLISSIKNFRHLYEALLREPKEGRQPGFDFKAAVAAAEEIAGHKSLLGHTAH